MHNTQWIMRLLSSLIQSARVLFLGITKTTEYPLLILPCIANHSRCKRFFVDSTDQLVNANFSSETFSFQLIKFKSGGSRSWAID